MSPLVLAQHVTKWYGPRRAVTDVSFAIEPGEIVGLLGPNGSGKSTIFRMLTGYLVPTSGRIEVEGHDVVADSFAVRRVISYVPEDAPLYDHMRVNEFLHFMANLKGLRGAAAKAAVDAAAERLDLTRVMMLLTAKLSRGFRQRVSIAQALLGNPHMLVLDEPTSGLDPHQVIAVRDLIRVARGKSHRADRITHPSRDRKDRLAGHDPARWRASDRRCAEGESGRDNVAACGSCAGTDRQRRRLLHRRRA